MSVSGEEIRREEERIRSEYARRESEIPPDRYSLAEPGVLFAYQGQRREVIGALAREGLFPLEGREILEVGCGTGQWLVDFVSWGARPSGLHGLDLLEDRIAAAWKRLPGSAREGGGVDLKVGSATELPWPDASFHVVLQSTLLSSVLDDGVRRRIAGEMLRVLRDDGVLLSYDLARNNPENPAVRGVPESELRALFRGCAVRARRITLAPPLARRLAPRAWLLARALERLRILNTHLLAVIRKGEAST